jgi:hypothetical protein
MICSKVPEGRLKIARRFNAGYRRIITRVPKGRLVIKRCRNCFSRPFGTWFNSFVFPALKRRAIVISPFGRRNDKHVVFKVVGLLRDQNRSRSVRTTIKAATLI